MSTDVGSVQAATGAPPGRSNAAITTYAIAASAALVTSNVREFERLPALVLEDWNRQVFGVKCPHLLQAFQVSPVDFASG